MPPLRRQALVMRDGVALEEVRERERRDFLLQKHGPDPGRVRVVDPRRASQTPDPTSTLQPRIATIKQVTHIVFLRPTDRGA